MSSRNMSLLPRAALRSGSEQLQNIKQCCISGWLCQPNQETRVDTKILFLHFREMRDSDSNFQESHEL
jgi:hypothetical protein